jgi:hypothetical protein
LASEARTGWFKRNFSMVRKKNSVIIKQKLVKTIKKLENVCEKQSK